MANNLPIVTVICTCYNHALYVKEALDSVLRQTYPNVQLIVVDNFSNDGSVEVIQTVIAPFPEVVFLQNKENKGICRAFNEAAVFAKGKYLIDLAADDVLLVDRIQRQVIAFESLPAEYALVYTNMELIDNKGTHLHDHFSGQDRPPSGNVFASLLEKHFLTSPSTMFKTSVFFSLGGYNDTLAFEDFDYWIRCARNYSFQYLPFISTKKRILPRSLSTQFYDTDSNKMLESTFVSFHWANTQLQTQKEKKAFVKGASYYFRQSALLGHFDTSKKFYSLLRPYLSTISLSTLFCLLLFRIKGNSSRFYKLYRSLLS